MIAGLESISGGRDPHRRPQGQRHAAPRRPEHRDGCSRTTPLPHLSVFEKHGVRLRKMRRPPGPDEVRQRVMEGGERILKIEQLWSASPREAVGGQRQRVAMGRATSATRIAFLFDEPLSKHEIAKLRNGDATPRIKRLHDKAAGDGGSKTSPHDQVEAMTLADRIVVLNSGIIEQIGSTREIYNQPPACSSPASNQLAAEWTSCPGPAGGGVGRRPAVDLPGVGRLGGAGGSGRGGIRAQAGREPDLRDPDRSNNARGGGRRKPVLGIVSGIMPVAVVGAAGLRYPRLPAARATPARSSARLAAGGRARDRSRLPVRFEMGPISTCFRTGKAGPRWTAPGRRGGAPKPAAGGGGIGREPRPRGREDRAPQSGLRGARGGATMKRCARTSAPASPSWTRSSRRTPCRRGAAKHFRRPLSRAARRARGPRRR